MMNLNIESAREEQGFTLVELAVVMVIIGLLIGGILKGQEMIANQQINSSIAQVKSIDAATSTFRDVYAALPGDMVNATSRIPGCEDPCGDGDGDNTLNNAPNDDDGDIDEGYDMYRHLAGADLLGGLSVTAADGVTTSTLATNLNGRYFVPGYNNAAAFGLQANAKSGHYLYLATVGGGNDDALTPLEAARIDRKLDDGNPEEGSVFGEDADCQSGDDDTLYDEQTSTKNCDLFIRFNS